LGRATVGTPLDGLSRKRIATETGKGPQPLSPWRPGVSFGWHSTATSARVKEGVRKALELRGELARTQREIQEQERQLKAITDDQVRLRANLREMPATAAACKRYLQKFDQQETTIEKFQQDIRNLQETEHEQKKALDDFLAAFSAEWPSGHLVQRSCSSSQAAADERRSAKVRPSGRAE
jgi:septal ring factor EnvC (AmiA/AmiB activator)